VQSKHAGKTLNLPTRQYLCQGVSNHVMSGAVCNIKGSVFNSLVDEIIMYVDVFGAGMEIVYSGDLAYSLVVAIKEGQR